MAAWRAAAPRKRLIERDGDERAGPPAARSGRGLARRQCPDRRAAAGQCAARADRIQDRHLLRLSRCMGGRLRWPHDHRRLGRPPGWRAGAGPCRPRQLPRRSCSMPSRAAGRRRRRSLPAPSGRADRRYWPACRRRCSATAPGCDRAMPCDPPRIMFPPNGARLEVACRRAESAAQGRGRDGCADGAGQWRSGRRPPRTGGRCFS